MKPPLQVLVALMLLSPLTYAEPSNTVAPAATPAAQASLPKPIKRKVTIKIIQGDKDTVATSMTVPALERLWSRDKTAIDIKLTVKTPSGDYRYVTLNAIAVHSPSNEFAPLSVSVSNADKPVLSNGSSGSLPPRSLSASFRYRNGVHRPGRLRDLPQ
jgi:hypothetical protein